MYHAFDNNFDKNDILINEEDVKKLKQSVLLGCLFNIIEIWLKAIVFETEALNKIQPKQYNDIDLAEQLNLENVILVKGKRVDDVSELGDYYSDLLKDKMPQGAFNDITPIGWLVLALIKKDLIGPKNIDNVRRVALNNFLEKPILINLLSDFKIQQQNDFKNGQEAKLSELWPLEYIPKGSEESNNIEDILEPLREIEKLTNIKIQTVLKKHFNYDNVNNTFQNRWPLSRWQIDIAGDNRPFSEESNGEIVSNWTESKDKEQRLLYLSSCGERYGKIFNILKRNESTPQSDQNHEQIDISASPRETLSSASVANNEGKIKTKTEEGLSTDEAAISETVKVNGANSINNSGPIKENTEDKTNKQAVDSSKKEP